MDLKNPRLSMTLHWEDKNGKSKPVICHSWVINFIDILRIHLAQLGGVAGPTLMDNTGNNRAFCQITATTFSVVAGATTQTFGIQVGTGNTAVAITDTQLETLIAHGNGAGQLMYGACGVGAPATVGTTRRLAVSRTFTNDSAGDITVLEVGLSGVCLYNPAVTGYFLLERTLNTRLIPTGTSATAVYTIGVTV